MLESCANKGEQCDNAPTYSAISRHSQGGTNGANPAICGAYQDNHTIFPLGGMYGFAATLNSERLAISKNPLTLIPGFVVDVLYDGHALLGPQPDRKSDRG